MLPDQVFDVRVRIARLDGEPDGHAPEAKAAIGVGRWIGGIEDHGRSRSGRFIKPVGDPRQQSVSGTFEITRPVSRTRQIRRM